MSQAKIALSLLLVLLLAACSRPVPLMHSLELAKQPSQKIAKKVMIVMPKEQAELVIHHKPDPLADTYVFAGGPSIKDSLYHVMGQVYAEVAFTHDLASSTEKYDQALHIDFKDYKIKLNIYTGNVVDLEIDYRLTDPSGATLMTIPTKTSSKDRYSPGELVSSLLLGTFANVSNMKESSGAAWDQAASNSILELLDKILPQEKKSP